MRRGAAAILDTELHPQVAARWARVTLYAWERCSASPCIYFETSIPRTCLQSGDVGGVREVNEKQNNLPVIARGLHYPQRGIPHEAGNKPVVSSDGWLGESGGGEGPRGTRAAPTLTLCLHPRDLSPRACQRAPSLRCSGFPDERQR